MSEPSSAPLPAFARQEPTLAELARLLWRDRRPILIGGAAGLCLGIVFLALAIPQYRATMLVAPVTRSATGDMAATLPDNAGFASEYMLKSFSAGDAADFAWFEHVLREPSVASRLLQDPLIRNGVAQDRAFRFQPARTPQNPEALAEYLQDHVTVQPVGSTPMRRLTFNHADRAFAVDMLQTLARTTDELIRADMRQKADQRIDWLQHTIAGAQNFENRRALTALLIEQQRLRTMLDMKEAYAARVAEPASATLRPVWPRAPLFLPLFTLAGLMAGACAASLRRTWPS